MGLIVDTNVFISFEKTQKTPDVSKLPGGDGIFISVVTVSELLVGVHRAKGEERQLRRRQFVEGIIHGIRVLDFTVAIARVHAEISAELAAQGNVIGSHDLIIAATAIYFDLALITDNVQEFSRVPRLHVVSFNS